MRRGSSETEPSLDGTTHDPEAGQEPGRQGSPSIESSADDHEEPPSLIWPPPEAELDGFEIVHIESTGRTIIEPMRYAPPDGAAGPGVHARPDLTRTHVAASQERLDPPHVDTLPPKLPSSASRFMPGSTTPGRPVTPPVLSDPDENLPETQVIEPLLGESLVGPRSMTDRRPTSAPRMPVTPSAAPTVVIPRPAGPVPPSGRDQTEPRLVPLVGSGAPGSRPGAQTIVPPSSLEDTIDPAAQTRIIPIPPGFRTRVPAPVDNPAHDLATARTVDTTTEETRIITRPPTARAAGVPAPDVTPVESAWHAAGGSFASPWQSARSDDRAAAEWPFRTPEDQKASDLAAAGAAATGKSIPAWRIALIIIAILAVAQIAYLIVRTLQPAAGAAVTGTLVVESAPVGAEVYIDGALRGRTPFRIELAPGSHALEVRSGELRRTRNVTLQAGALVSHMVELAAAPVPVAPPAPATAAIEVRSEPAGARVSIGGVDRGRTPVVVSGLQPGRHQIKVSGPFDPVFRRVTVAAGQHALIVVTPARSETEDRTDRDEERPREEPAPSALPAAGRGWIMVDSPLVLRVVRNGDFLGTSEDSRIQLPAGTHDITLENESVNFREVRKVDVAVNRGVTVSVSMPQGTLNINAQPWAEVFVDNQRVGETPVSQLLLPIGPHEVLFRHPQLGERRVTVVVKVGTPGRTFADFTK